MVGIPSYADTGGSVGAANQKTTTVNPGYGADFDWYHKYSGAMNSGTANFGDYAKYQNMAKKYGWQQGNISSAALHDMSIKALSGDKNAQAYLKNFHYNAQTGDALWKGVTNDQLNGNASLQSAYMKANPYADYTKNYETNQYNQFGQAIDGHQAISDKDYQAYQNYANKWHLDDHTSAYYQQQQQLGKDKQGALDAQDVALNQGLAAQDNSNFQQYQQMQQDMENRGMADSGIAADAYMRATMGANQNYQQAYADAATKKADITGQYDDAINKSKTDQQNFDYQKSQDAIHNKFAQDQFDYQKKQDALAQASAKVAAQSEQDKYMTAQSGILYSGGKPVLDSKGHPLTTLAYQQMQETSRHNQATEGLSHEKNKVTLANGQASANAKVQAASMAASAKLQAAQISRMNAQDRLAWEQTKQSSLNQQAEDKIKILKANAQSKKDGMVYKAYNDEMNRLNSTINKLVGKKSLNSDEKQKLADLTKQRGDLLDKVDKLYNQHGGVSDKKKVSTTHTSTTVRGNNHKNINKPKQSGAKGNNGKKRK